MIMEGIMLIAPAKKIRSISMRIILAANVSHVTGGIREGGRRKEAGNIDAPVSKRKTFTIYILSLCLRWVFIKEKSALETTLTTKISTQNKRFLRIKKRKTTHSTKISTKKKASFKKNASFKILLFFFYEFPNFY